MERAAALTGFAGRTMIAAGYERPCAEGERTATSRQDPFPLNGCLDAIDSGGIVLESESAPRAAASALA